MDGIESAGGRDYEERARPEERAIEKGSAEHGALSNTHTSSSNDSVVPLNALPGFPEYAGIGAIDWLEWSSIVDWNALRTPQIFEAFDEIKEQCQRNRREDGVFELRGFGPIRIGRMGMRRGGARGQHFRYHIGTHNIVVGLANNARQSAGNPNMFARVTGRACLLLGHVHARELILTLIDCLGGTPKQETLSRADLCFDVVGLAAEELQDLVVAGHAITRATSIRPHDDIKSGERSGFTAGVRPGVYLNCYDKLREVVGRCDELYHEAMAMRRWGGQLLGRSTRIEFQLQRKWLRKKGVLDPETLHGSCGSIIEYLTRDWFRLTDRSVDRTSKNQAHTKMHPLWNAIRQSWLSSYDGRSTALKAIDRSGIDPARLGKIARGCLRNALHQMGVQFENYDTFVKEAAQLLSNIGSHEERILFMREAAAKQTDAIG